MGYLTNQTIFISGGTGCAGIHITKDLLSHYPAIRIRATSYKHTPIVVNDPRLEYIFCELKDQDSIQAAVKGCDGAVLVAAYTAGAGHIATSPSAHLTENALMNVQTLEALHRAGVKRIIYVGSASLYQESSSHLREDDLDLNRDPHPSYFGYGWMARFTEKVCQYWNAYHGMNIICTRTANIYGPYAKFDPRYSNFIPAIIRKAVDRMDPFDVWGHPEITRDVLFAPDFARAVVMLLDQEKLDFTVFNLGSGRQTRVDEVVQEALQSSGYSPREIKYLSDKPTTISFRALDCTRIQEQIGWKPQFSLAEGIGLTTEWWKENKENWTK